LILQTAQGSLVRLNKACTWDSRHETIFFAKTQRVYPYKLGFYIPAKDILPEKVS